MRKREACCGREQFPVRYNKAVRASSIRRRMELRGLCVPARANRRGAWTGPPRSILITRAKNLYDQKTPKGHQNFTLGKYKPSRSVLTNRDCSATLGAANDGSARPLCLRAPAGQPFAYSRVGKGRTLSAVPSNSNFPASHLGSQPSLIAQSYRAFFISATLSLNHMPDKPTQKTRTTRKSRPRRLEGPRRGISEPKVASDI